MNCYFYFVYSLLDLRNSECNVVSLYVSLLMCLFVLGVACLTVFVLGVACLTVFVNCLVKKFAMCLGVVTILLLNVMDVFSVCGGALLDRPCMVF